MGKHPRPNSLRPRGYVLDNAERDCGCPGCLGATGWRREHAHRVWQAMQAVVAVMAIVDLSDSIFSEYWDEAARIGLYLDSNATGGGNE
jgi:hypothetical protein